MLWFCLELVGSQEIAAATSSPACSCSSFFSKETQWLRARHEATWPFQADGEWRAWNRNSNPSGRESERDSSKPESGPAPACSTSACLCPRKVRNSQLDPKPVAPAGFQNVLSVHLQSSGEMKAVRRPEALQFQTQELKGGGQRKPQQRRIRQAG